MNKSLKVVLIVCAIVLVLAAAGSSIYYFVFFRAEKERAEITLQEQQLEFETEKKIAEELKLNEEKAKEEQRKLEKEIELAKQLADLNNWYNEAMNKAYERYQKDIEHIDKFYQNSKVDLFRLYD